MRDTGEVVTINVLVLVFSYSRFRMFNLSYSVPKEYIGKVVSYWIIEEKIYICFEHKLIAVHIQSDKKLNYHREHYVDVLKSHFVGMGQDEILNIAKENLKVIGGRFNCE